MRAWAWWWSAGLTACGTYSKRTSLRRWTGSANATGSGSWLWRNKSKPSDSRTLSGGWTVGPDEHLLVLPTLCGLRTLAAVL
ncbi:hypothetical protein PF005_g391 [Phytophthora fragariae]|uniref:Secreted protein n=1 Tax=Phytophthora fragariae TaxID=53985 RepID=A0A6A3ZP32_9STRA|nr:hypothetical protein PF003_g9801 [Phytophthora fragariae]KAE8950068.1 hypothetical protein PF009_g368 [Phytophthora fragariae]KAE9139457.1 hypothetical protein PF007_g1032 [Phytophthora fragariae]KAE9155848.1 hypothetical protein PF006_g266 [Phytophthora fragariae]KAE9238078.1 hypothetical protein PF005_g391 [Phytophthora fragariae]